jgi:hypothetical protein
VGQTEAEQRIMDGSAWNDFCDQLKELGELVFRPEVPADPFNRALGYRHLLRLLRGGIESAIDYADPQYPAFFRLADETKGVLNDNPDNYYQNCIIDGRFDYRISGKRGTVPWFSIGTKASAGEVAGMVSTGEIDATRIRFEDDGTFEIIVSKDEKPGNWLPTTDATRMAIVRQSFGDRTKEEITQLEIECLNPERPTNTLQPGALEAQMRQALGFVGSTATLGIDWMQRYKSKHLNALPEDDQALCQAAGGDPNIHYYQSYWDLEPDQALLVHLTDIPECQTWNLQLSDYWMESLDFRFFQISVNRFTASYESDGSVFIVVSEQDPGPRYPNWLRTLGYGQGGMLGRYVGAKNPPKEMASTIVKISELQSSAGRPAGA